MSDKSILIADDDRDLLRALTTRLKAEGYTVHLARDGYQALEFSQTSNPDVILLDINMPAGNGPNVMERLRTLASTEMTPVVFMTGEQSQRIDELAQHSGAVAVLKKPFEFKQLKEAIERATEKTEDVFG